MKNTNTNPSFDSWRPWSGAGHWTWELRGPDTRALNVWTADMMSELFRRLAEVARPARVVLDGAPTAALADGEFETPVPALLTKYLATQTAQVQSMELTLDLLTWFRAEGSDGEPRHAWLSRGATLWATLGAEASTFTLAIDHTLFVDGDVVGESNRELHQKNRPVLARVIEAMSELWGPVVEFGGLPGVTATGFATAAG